MTLDPQPNCQSHATPSKIEQNSYYLTTKQQKESIFLYLTKSFGKLFHNIFMSFVIYEKCYPVTFIKACLSIVSLFFIAFFIFFSTTVLGHKLACTLSSAIWLVHIAKLLLGEQSPFIINITGKRVVYIFDSW